MKTTSASDLLTNHPKSLKCLWITFRALVTTSLLSTRKSENRPRVGSLLFTPLSQVSREAADGSSEWQQCFFLLYYYSLEDLL